MKSLNERIQKKLIELTAERDAHREEANRLDCQINSLLLMGEIGELEELLALVESPLEEVVIVPPPPELVIPPPPIPRVRITADKVYAATQLMENLFTLRDITDVICDAEGVTDAGEKTRVRSAISSMLTKLKENGRVIHVSIGRRGKQPGQFRKTPPRALPGYKNGAPADIEIIHVVENGEETRQ